MNLSGRIQRILSIECRCISFLEQMLADYLSKFKQKLVTFKCFELRKMQFRLKMLNVMYFKFLLFDQLNVMNF